MTCLMLNYKRVLEETSHLCGQLRGYGIKNQVSRLSLLQLLYELLSLDQDKVQKVADQS